jgi:tRNA pseudouridine(38-40) synthase
MKIFEGTHCFKNFATLNIHEPDRSGYVRTIFDIDVSQQDCPSLLSGCKEILVNIKGKSFLWHQIRIIVKAAVSYADGEISLYQLNNLLTGDD